MPDLALHFTVPDGADAHALAAEVGNRLANLAAVASATATAEEQRYIGPPEIVVVLAAADAPADLRRLLDDVRRLGEACGLTGGRLEVGMRQVALDAVSDGDLRAAAA